MEEEPSVQAGAPPSIRSLDNSAGLPLVPAQHELPPCSVQQNPLGTLGIPYFMDSKETVVIISVTAGLTQAMEPH